jgi:hypothetical protein
LASTVLLFLTGFPMPPRRRAGRIAQLRYLLLGSVGRVFVASKANFGELPQGEVRSAPVLRGLPTRGRNTCGGIIGFLCTPTAKTPLFYIRKPLGVGPGPSGLPRITIRRSSAPHPPPPGASLRPRRAVGYVTPLRLFRGRQIGFSLLRRSRGFNGRDALQGGGQQMILAPRRLAPRFDLAP